MQGACPHQACFCPVEHASKTSDLFTMASMASGSSVKTWADHVLQDLCQAVSALLSHQYLVVRELSCAPVPAFVGGFCNPSRLAVDSLDGHVS